MSDVFIATKNRVTVKSENTNSDVFKATPYRQISQNHIGEPIVKEIVDFNSLMPSKESLKKYAANTAAHNTVNKLLNGESVSSEQIRKAAKTYSQEYNSGWAALKKPTYMNVAGADIAKELNSIANKQDFALFEAERDKRDKQNAVRKLKNGEALTEEERKKLSDIKANGQELLGTFGRIDLGEYIPEGTSQAFDFYNIENPQNQAILSKAKNLMDKEISGIKLTDEEKDYIETAKLYRKIVKDRAQSMATISDIETNKRNAALVKAEKMYGDATYGNNLTFGIGNVKTTSIPVSDNKNADRTTAKIMSRADLYINTGLNQYMSGIGNTIDIITGNGYEKISKKQYSAYDIASFAIRQHFENNGENFNVLIQDVATNMANNAIPMLMGVATGGLGAPAALANAVGTFSFGVSIFGNAYKEGVDLGVDDQSRLITYAFMNTALECGLEYAIGGIPGVGGVLSGDAIESAAKLFKGVFAKAAVKMAGNGFGEFVEEGTQSILGPIMQKWILGADVNTIFDDPTGSLSQAAYEGAVGFLSSLFMGAGNNIFSASYDSYVQKIGHNYKQSIESADISLSDIAAFFTETAAQKSELFKAANEVKKGDTSDIAVGKMITEAMNAKDEALRFTYKRAYEQVENNGGFDAFLTVFENNIENGMIYPDSVMSNYENIMDWRNIGVKADEETAGKLIYEAQLYAPRALLMRELKNAAQTETNSKENTILQSGANGGIISDSENTVSEGGGAEYGGAERIYNDSKWSGRTLSNKQVGIGKSQENNGRVQSYSRENRRNSSSIRDKGNNRGIELTSEQSESLKTTAIKKEETLRKSYEQQRWIISNLSPKRQEYLKEKRIQYDNILKQLELGDKLISDNGDVVGEVVAMQDGNITIAGDKFIEIILYDSFSDDNVISFLETGGGFDISIKKQINANAEKLNNMEVVASLNLETHPTDKHSIMEWVLNKLSDTKSIITRKGFGEIIFDKKRIKNGFAYKKTNSENIAVLLVPKVLENGVEIYKHPNHKERGYCTTTFAAPIEINGHRGNLAVVVRQEGENYYKVHRVLTPDGSQFDFYKKRDIVETAGQVQNELDLSPTDNISNNNIPQGVNVVNNNMSAGEENM